MNRLFVFLAFFIGPVLLSSVVSCDSCRDSQPYRYRVERYEPVLQRSTDRNAYDLGTPIPLTRTLTNGDSIRYKALEIGLQGREVLASRSVGGFALYACDPAVTPISRINQLTVTSDQSYNARFKAGDDLSELMVIGHSSLNQQPLATFLNGAQPTADSYIVLRFAEPTDRVAAHRFTIRVQTDGGQVMESQTESVIITP
ncbi:MAG: hypothetical protein H7319_17145 [Spirosoma sp.]|nr:hypothetical protein [Spirosoma sp.]